MQKVLTCAQMRAADKYTIQQLGVSSQELMERAGAAIAEETEKLLRKIGGSRVLAVCGGGNNGGENAAPKKTYTPLQSEDFDAPPLMDEPIYGDE